MVPVPVPDPEVVMPSSEKLNVFECVIVTVPLIEVPETLPEKPADIRVEMLTPEMFWFCVVSWMKRRLLEDPETGPVNGSTKGSPPDERSRPGTLVQVVAVSRNVAVPSPVPLALPSVVLLSTTRMVPVIE